MKQCNCYGEGKKSGSTYSDELSRAQGGRIEGGGRLGVGRWAVLSFMSSYVSFYVISK